MKIKDIQTWLNEEINIKDSFKLSDISVSNNSKYNINIELEEQELWK